MSGLQPPEFWERLEQTGMFYPRIYPFIWSECAVRDALLGRRTHDLDFVIPRAGLRLCRVADALGAAFYVLDEERDTGRVVLNRMGAAVSRFLRCGDLTLKAICATRRFSTTRHRPGLRAAQSLVDPLGGRRPAFQAAKLCSPASFPMIRCAFCVGFAWQSCSA